MDSYTTDYLMDFREVELAEYMREARPRFTSGALCRGSIYEEIENVKSQALERGLGMPVDISTTFFPSRGGASKVAKAKEMCNRCPVQWECFEYAYVGNELAGVWGGASVDERVDCHKNELEPEAAFVSLFGRKQFKKKQPKETGPGSYR